MSPSKATALLALFATLVVGFVGYEVLLPRVEVEAPAPAIGGGNPVRERKGATFQRGTANDGGSANDGALDR